MFKLYLYGIEIRRYSPGYFYAEGSNCTFMELKLRGRDSGFQPSVVQIVPLWN